MKADIFFFITSVLTLLIGGGLLIAVFYIIRIVRRIDHVAGVVKEEGDALIHEVRIARAKIKTDGITFGRIVTFITALIKMMFSKTSKRKNK